MQAVSARSGRISLCSLTRLDPGFRTDIIGSFLLAKCLSAERTGLTPISPPRLPAVRVRPVLLFPPEAAWMLISLPTLQFARLICNISEPFCPTGPITNKTSSCLVRDWFSKYRVAARDTLPRVRPRSHPRLLLRHLRVWL